MIKPEHRRRGEQPAGHRSYLRDHEQRGEQRRSSRSRPRSSAAARGSGSTRRRAVGAHDPPVDQARDEARQREHDPDHEQALPRLHARGIRRPQTSSLSSAPSWRRRCEPGRDAGGSGRGRARRLLILARLRQPAREGDPPRTRSTATRRRSAASSSTVLLAACSGSGAACRGAILRAPAARSWPRALGLALAGTSRSSSAPAAPVGLDAADEQGLTPDAWDSSRAGAYAANFVAVALVGPIVEELMYRGAGMALLRASGDGRGARHRPGFGLGHGLCSRSRTRLLRPCDRPPPAEDGQRLSVHVVHCAFNATSLILAVTT